MHPKAYRLAKVVAGLMLGVVFQATAPIGCAGYLQQNLEVLRRLDTVAGSPEFYQSLLWRLFGGAS